MIKEKKIEDVIVAGHRVKAKYEEMPRFFDILYKEFKHEIVGSSFCLYYDEGCKEIADYEVCFPIKELREVEGFSVKRLSGGKAVTMIHKGSYESIPKSWEKLFEYIKDKGYQPILPSREVYAVCCNKVDNEEDYETEIQVLIK